MRGGTQHRRVCERTAGQRKDRVDRSQGGSRKYSNENLEDLSSEGVPVISNWAAALVNLWRQGCPAHASFASFLAKKNVGKFLR